MVDVFSPAKRSRIMASVKSTGNRGTEAKLADLLRRRGINGWRRKATVFGKPDFIFRRERLAVFVDGCFWHSCPLHASRPKTNTAFWMKKFTANRKRDRLVNKELRALGWTILRIWEHELRQPESVVRRINHSLRKKPQARLPAKLRPGA
jgi:DNA mismatch endonuclease, patch repair protein